ncbi:hypothetical protein Gotri_019738 [Gossypium trilobum]|uniref:Uncharacterized protein n=1 Tax=Gossypium trilobum TaxID=34281 RepID=A0A7J9EDX9_9ROSI|nr:hypothetical protein [Gossypium trilobum]
MILLKPVWRWNLTPGRVMSKTWRATILVKYIEIQSTKQVSLSNYDVNISAGGQDLRPVDLSTYLPQKIFMGFSGSTSNET